MKKKRHVCKEISKFRNFPRKVSILFASISAMTISPRFAFAETSTPLRAGKLAETGDLIAMLAMGVGLIAVVALIVSIISKKSKAKNRSTWKYPF